MSSTEPIAIIGMACRLPGAGDTESLWRLLMANEFAWGAAPSERLNRALFLDRGAPRATKTYTDLAGLMPSLAVRRAGRFGATNAANAYDIAHQIFLDETCAALSDAGIDPDDMSRRERCGVYVGHTGGSDRIGDLVYSTGIEPASRLLHHTELAGLLGAAATSRIARELVERVRNRYGSRAPEVTESLAALDCARIVQQALAFRGPAMVFDAACASGLQALAVAVRALRAGRIDQAIVGAVSHFKADSLVLFSAAQSVSRSGSFPFCSDADGLVTAEGQVALVLKPLSMAMRDGHRIRAVIETIGISSDGRGKSLWAPRSDGQLLAMRRAYPKPSLIATLGYIEAHATGTQVGDATELEALTALLRPHLANGERVLVGSLKANIGHTLETAGLASLVKLVLAMERGVIPPGVADRPLNEALSDSALVRVASHAQPWPDKLPEQGRRGAVNAFGIGGINVHLVASRGACNAEMERRPHKPNRIRLSAIECILPGSPDKKAFLDRVARAESALVEAPPSRWSVEHDATDGVYRPFKSMLRQGGYIQGYAFDWRAFRIPPRQIAAANPLQFMIIEAVGRALRETGPIQADSTAVLVGTSFGGDFSNELQLGLRLPETCETLRPLLSEAALGDDQIESVLADYERTLLERYPALRDETGSFTASSLATRVSKVFNLMGGAFAIDAGIHSTAAALCAAQDLLSEGACSTVVCALAQRHMDLFAYEGLSLEFARHSRQGNGLEGSIDPEAWVPGEGVIVLVLKRAADVGTGPVIESVTVSSAPPSDAARTPRIAAGSLVGNLGAADAAVELLQSAGSPSAIIRRTDEAGETEIVLVQQAGQRKKKVAAVFPGQGSQYENCFRDMVLRSPLAADVLGDIDALADCLQYPSLAQTAWRSDHEMGRSVWATQWAVFLSDLFAWRVLQRLGVKVDCVAGHSFGEFPMAVAAGAISFREGALLARARADAIDQHGGAGSGLLSILADESLARELLQASGDRLWISALNAPRQTVVGGVGEALDALERLCDERRVACRRLSVGCAFHTPLLARAAQHFAQAVERVRLANVDKPLYSATAGGRIANAQALQSNFIAQLTEPVRWVDTVRALYEDGVRTFIEAGPAGVLSGLIRQVLKDAPDIEVITMDPRGRVDSGDPVETLREQLVAGQLAEPISAVSAATRRSPGKVTRFDASAVRRARNRARSLARSTPDALPDRPVSEPPLSERNEPAPESSGELHHTIVEFVIEHTGYPRDMIDFTLDLEADLGIDSIRKAQLIAELGARFEVKREAGIALADFLTLSDIESFFRSRIGTRGSRTAPAPQDQQSADSSSIPLDWVLASVPETGLTGVLLSLERGAEATLEDIHNGATRQWLLKVDGRALLAWNEAGLVLMESSAARTEGPELRAIRVSADTPLATLLSGARTIEDLTLDQGMGGRLVFALWLAPNVFSDPVTSWTAGAPRTPAAHLALDEYSGQWGRVIARLMQDDAGAKEARQQLSAAGRWIAVSLAGQKFKIAGGDGLNPEWAEQFTDRQIVPAGDTPRAAPIAHRYALQLIPKTSGEGPSAWGIETAVTVIGEGAVADEIGHALDRALVQHWRRSMLDLSAVDRAVLALPAFLGADAVEPFGADDAVLPALVAELQRWLMPLERDEAVPRHLLAVINLGGDLGLSGARLNPRAAALLGLLKGLSREYESLKCRVVDIGAEHLDAAIASRLVMELSDRAMHAEVALSPQARHVLGVIPAPLSGARQSEPLPSGVWLATGGASGITAECMFALARRYRLKVALVGRTRLAAACDGPEGEGVHRKRAQQRRHEIAALLARYDAEGLEAHYFACDLAHRDEVAQLIEEIEGRCGPIDGVVHGAGIEQSARFTKKSADTFRATFEPKCTALDVLIDSLGAPDRARPPAMLIAFGSTSGQFGGHGQADYASANQLLSRRVARLRRDWPDLKATCIHWHAWDEVGMASRGGVRWILEQFGLKLLPVSEGIAHFLAEIEAGLPLAEVVITEPSLIRANHARVPEGTASAESQRLVTPSADDRNRLRIVLDAATQPCLADHRLDGVPLLPAAMAAELIFQVALREAKPLGAVELTSLLVSRPINVPDGAPLELEARISEDGGRIELRPQGADAVSIHAQVTHPGASPAAALACETAPFPLYPAAYFETASLRHGPSLQTLKGSYFERNGGWAELEAPDPFAIVAALSLEVICTPVALLDGCFYACGMFSYFLCGQRIERPLAIGRLTVSRVPARGERCRMRFRLVEQQAAHSVFDFSLFDAAHRLVLDVRGLRMGLFS